jgi:hypothetical protein
VQNPGVKHIKKDSHKNRFLMDFVEIGSSLVGLLQFTIFLKQKMVLWGKIFRPLFHVRVIPLLEINAKLCFF